MNRCGIVIAGLVVVSLTAQGCTVIYQKPRKDRETVALLKNKYDEARQKLSELERAKRELEERLAREIGEKQVKVGMDDRGRLVITFVAEVLFDSGKADLKPAAKETLDKIAPTLKTTVGDLEIGVEGHTDNQPIRYSGWKSNWELSAARAMSVVRYLVEKHGVEPTRIHGTGYGEFRPVASNDTPQGRAKNRRVEIVVYPAEKIEKTKGVLPRADTTTMKQENLK